MNKKVLERLKNPELILKIFIIFSVLIYIIVFSAFNYKHMSHIMDSDVAGEMILGKSLSDENQLFLSKNVCYNTEVRLFDIQFFTAPLFHFSDNWILITILANAVCTILYFISMYCLLRNLNKDKRLGAFLGALAMLLPFSYNYYYIGLFGGFYITKLILETLIMGLLTGLLNISNRNKLKLIMFAFLSVFTFIAGLKSIRYLLVIFIPVCLSALFIWIFELNSSNSKIELKDLPRTNGFRILCLTIIITVVNLLGYLVNMKVLSKVYTFENYSGMQFGDMKLERGSERLGGFLEIMGYRPGAEVFSIEGITNLLIAFTIVFFVYCTCYLFKRFADLTMTQRFVMLFSVIGLLFNSFIFLVLDNFTARYYVPVYIFMISVFVIYGNYKTTKAGDWVLKNIVFITLVSYFAFTCMSTVDMIRNTDAVSTRRPAIDYLKENDYEYGFASYWNGPVISGLTNGEIVTANVTEFNTFTPFMWNTDKKFYNRDYWNDKCFLLLTKEENETQVGNETIKLGQLVYADDNFVVYHFDSPNIIYQSIDEKTN